MFSSEFWDILKNTSGGYFWFILGGQNLPSNKNSANCTFLLWDMETKQNSGIGRLSIKSKI